MYSKPDFNFFFLAGSLVLDKAALTLWCIKLIIWDCLACDLALKDFLFKVSTISCLVLNLTPTVSLGSSSVYNLLPEPLGFLPVPFLGSASVNLLFKILNTSSFSCWFKFLGNKGSNFSCDTLEAFLAAVPLAPDCVMVGLTT